MGIYKKPQDKEINKIVLEHDKILHESLEVVDGAFVTRIENESIKRSKNKVPFMESSIKTTKGNNFTVRSYFSPKFPDRTIIQLWYMAGSEPKKSKTNMTVIENKYNYTGDNVLGNRIAVIGTTRQKS